MKKVISLCLLALLAFTPATAKKKIQTVKLHIVETSDVHGSFFPYDFINRKPKRGTLARVSTYVKRLREEYGDNVILVDNGDILQGQPTCYYYNYVDTESTNVAADVINYMKYDAETFGNHDVETGHACYDKWIKEVKCPMLGANIINTATGADPSAISYTMLNVLIAIITAFLFERGYLEKAQGVMTAMLLDAAVGGIMGGFITWFIYGAEGENTSSSLVHGLVTNVGMTPFAAELIGGFFVDIADKAICVFLSLAIVYILPVKIRKAFKIHAWRQAPLTSDVLKDIRRNRSRQTSLRIKLVTLLTWSAIIVGASAIYICYIMFFNSTVDHQKVYAMGIAQMAAGMVDGDKIDEYIALGQASADYRVVESNLEKIRSSSNYTEYVYVYKIQEDGCHVVFDVAEVGGDVSRPGAVIPFDESFSEYIPTLLKGGRIDPIITDDTYGWLLTIYEPILSSAGDVTAYAGVDISMDSLRTEAKRYIVKVMSAFVGVFALTLAIGLYFAEYHVILPLNTMAYTASLFTENKENALKETAEMFHKLHIITGDETENLYNAFSEMTDENLEYLMDIQKKNELISRMQDSLILVLADMVESRDKNTGDHVKKTAEYAKLIMDEMVKEGIYKEQLTEKFRSDVYRSAPLHDIGKISVSDAILNKNGKLTDEEFAQMKGHTTAGAEILDRVMATVPGSDAGYLNEARTMALYHHEKWNGQGYPNGIAGDEIPLSARIMAVADVFDALVSNRSYKKGFPFEKSIGIIKESLGSHFDPYVDQAFLNVQDKAKEIMDKTYGDDATYGDET